MIQPLKGGEEVKKRRTLGAGGPDVGSQKPDPATDTPEEDDIDPAEFFDPEEFGYRRRNAAPWRP